VGLPRGRDLAVARRHRLLRETPVGRAGPHRARPAEPAPRPSIEDVNLWAAIILAGLLLDFAVERLADVLNLGHLGRPLPPELRDLVLALPFSWWSTFVIEERFGFNRTTPRTFWTDVVKGGLLALVLGGPLLAALLWLLLAAGARAWLWCWLASALYLIAVQVIAPTWI